MIESDSYTAATARRRLQVYYARRAPEIASDPNAYAHRVVKGLSYQSGSESPPSGGYASTPAQPPKALDGDSFLPDIQGPAKLSGGWIESWGFLVALWLALILFSFVFGIN